MPAVWVLVGVAALAQIGLGVWVWRQYRGHVRHAFDPHPVGCLCERCMPNLPKFG